MTVKCPNCGVELALPDGLEEGQKIQCTVCQTKFFLEISHERDTKDWPIHTLNKNSPKKSFWKKINWKHLCVLLMIVFLVKVINYCARFAGGAVGSHVAEKDNAALMGMLQVANQRGDWVAEATNNLAGTSSLYRSFVFDVISSVKSLNAQGRTVVSAYEEGAELSHDMPIAEDILQTDAWLKRVLIAIEKCRCNSKLILENTQLDKNSSYYTIRQTFVGGACSTGLKKLDEYETLVRAWMEMVDCIRQHEKIKDKSAQARQQFSEQIKRMANRIDELERRLQKNHR